MTKTVYPKKDSHLKFGICLVKGQAYEATEDGDRWRIKIADNLFTIVEKEDVTTEPRKISPGDVYKATYRGTTNPLLVVKAFYPDSDKPEDEQKVWQIMGMGLSCNSNPFYRELHTSREVLDYLDERQMELAGNICSEVVQLVDKCVKA